MKITEGVEEEACVIVLYLEIQIGNKRIAVQTGETAWRRIINIFLCFILTSLFVLNLQDNNTHKGLIKKMQMKVFTNVMPMRSLNKCTTT